MSFLSHTNYGTRLSITTRPFVSTCRQIARAVSNAIAEYEKLTEQLIANSDGKYSLNNDGIQSLLSDWCFQIVASKGCRENNV